MSLPVQVKQYISMFGKYDMLYVVACLMVVTL